MYPNNTDEIKDPICPAVFIAPVTEPAYFLPMSRHTAHDVGSMKSDPEQLNARKPSATYLSRVSIVATVNSADAPTPHIAIVRRPRFNPMRRTSASLENPPARFAIAPRMNGNVDSSRSFSLKPRPLTRYVCSQERKKKD